MANKPLKTIKFPGLADTYTVPQIDATLAVSGKAADSKATGDRFDAVEADVTALQAELPDLTETVMSAFVVDTATGAIATFPDGADGVPVKSLTVEIEPVQSGSGDPSPSNVRPISGWTQAKVTRTGVNVWDEETEDGAWNNSTGAPVDSTTQRRNKNPISVVPNTTYYANKVLFRYYYDKDMNFVSYDSSGANQFTTPANARYMNVRQAKADWDGTNTSINYPSTDHDYHAGHVQTYTIDLDGTRYGGTLDVGTGVLTVDRQYIDMGSLSWTAGYTGFYTANVGWTGDFICEIYPQVPYVSSTSQVDKTITWNSGSHALITADSAYSDAASFKTAMSCVGLVTKLAQPQTVQLTAEEVTTLLGTNNIFADCGDVTCEYRADTKKYIEKILNA